MPGILGIDSVVFATRDLSKAREFYGRKMGLKVATYDEEGREVADEGPGFVNFRCGETLLGFEKGDAAEMATLVLKVHKLEAVLALLDEEGVRVGRRKDNWAMIRDPEGREIILQESAGDVQ